MDILKTLWRDFIGYENVRDKLDYHNTYAELVPREDWRAAPPKSTKEFHEMELPLAVAFVRPTGTRECSSRKSCGKVLRELQKRNMTDGMPDIQHNFYIGGDGNIYEGRGWEFMRSPIDEDDLAIHTSISIGVIGNWQVPNKMPPRKMVVAAIHLIKLGMKMGHLRADCLYQTIQARFTV